MVHSSTHLALCWHLVQFLEDSLASKTTSGREDSTGPGCNSGGWLERKQNRRQKFREQRGPSRESLQRSHIVSILRQIPALHFEAGLVEGDCKPKSEEQLSEELPLDVMWPLSAVSELGMFRVDWNAIPASADPLRGFGYKTPASTKRKSSRGECIRQGHDNGHNCGGGHDDCEGEEGRFIRGARKRSQVESIAAALQFLNLSAGSVVVDFGCGSGALSLPLACVFKDFTFVCVDYKQESLRLLDLRAQAAKLINLTTWQGRIEDYMEPFDACVALHACGHATDLALMQALRWRAGYVVSPCCVGKLQFAVGSPSFNGIANDNNYTPENLKAAIATKDGYLFPGLSNSSNVDQNEIHHSSTSVILKNSDRFEIEKQEFRANALRNSCGDIVGPFTMIMTPNLCGSISFENKAEEIHRCFQRLDEKFPRQMAGVTDHCLTYPRSRWLRSVITRSDFLLLARTADWSSYDYDSWTSRLHSLCKVIVELDRNLASQELGYWTSLFSLADQKAGAVGVSHILVGKPSMKSGEL